MKSGVVSSRPFLRSRGYHRFDKARSVHGPSLACVQNIEGCLSIYTRVLVTKQLFLVNFTCVVDSCFFLSGFSPLRTIFNLVDVQGFRVIADIPNHILLLCLRFP